MYFINKMQINIYNRTSLKTMPNFCGKLMNNILLGNFANKIKTLVNYFIDKKEIKNVKA